MSWFFYSILILLLALLVSPQLRRRLLSDVLFPAGYFLYTTQIAGYTLHRATYMSSAAKPAVPHTKVDTVKTYGENEKEQFKIVPIPVLEDNYAYLLLHTSSKTAALVDPADPYPIQQVMKQEYPEFKLTHILTTHKHWDHAGGNKSFAEADASLKIVGGRGEGVAAATIECGTGDTVEIASGFKVDIFQCPCHTKGHILFKIGKTLFTGDTLFAGGCGRFFEGNASQMYENLYVTLGPSVIPGSTQIFPGHEYTVANLEFAAWVEPENDAVKQKLTWAQERRAGKFPTIPTTMEEERSYNPFLRVKEESVISRVSRVTGTKSSSSISVEQSVRIMDALRTLKNENAHKKSAEAK